MKKKRLLIISLIFILLLSGCKGKKEESANGTGVEKPAAGSEEAAAQEAEAASFESPSEGGKEETPSDEGAEADTKEQEPAAPEVTLPFSNRFVYGDKNLFYIENDGNLTCLYKGREDEHLEYGTGDQDNFFFLVNGEGGQKFYFFNRDLDLSYTTVYYPEEMYASCISLMDGKLFYSGYDRKLKEDSTYFYDPSGDAFSSDGRVDRLKKILENYKGRTLRRLCTYTDMVRDIEKTGCIYMVDNETDEVIVFNDSGKEINTFKADNRDGDTKYYGPDYLIKEIHYYGDNKKGDEGEQEYVLYDVRSGESYEFSIGAEDGSGVVELKDGYVYFYEKIKDGSRDIGRDYKRVSIDSIRNNKLDPELIVHLDQPPNVDCVYGSYSEGNNGYDAFSVKDDRVYYLFFDGKGEDGRKGDVVWRYVLLDDPSKTPVKTGAVERHEDFADFGLVTAETDNKKDKASGDFVYFMGSYQSFRFNDDIKNADVMNKELEKIDEDFRKAGDEVARSAKSEIVDNAEEGNDVEWFRDYIGHGYSYDLSFSGASKVGEHHIQVAFDDYEYYGGAHGIGSSHYYLFNTDTGKTEKFTDLYKGSEEEFKEIALEYSINDWKNDPEYYYEDYDGTKESEDKMKESFLECISRDMNICFSDDGIDLCYPPYAVGPYASGEIRVRVPWFALGIEYSDI